jgi:hypothetical protein
MPAKIVRDDLLGVTFELCHSPHEDSVALGGLVLPQMALEIVGAGAGPLRQLVELLHQPRSDTRQAVLRSIQVICESGDENCEALFIAGAFKSLKLTLQTYPNDRAENLHRILSRFAPVLSRSSGARTGLLQLPE